MCNVNERLIFAQDRGFICMPEIDLGFALTPGMMAGLRAKGTITRVGKYVTRLLIYIRLDVQYHRACCVT